MREELQLQGKRLKKAKNRKKNRAAERARFHFQKCSKTMSDPTANVSSISCDRAVALHARNLVQCLHAQTLRKGIEYQRRVLEKLLD